jgi:hypothetical protein
MPVKASPGRRCGVQGAADGINRKPGLFRDLAGDALRPMTAPSRNLDILSRFSLRSSTRLQQFSISPDMFVALFLRQVEPVKASPGRFKCSGGRNEPA